MICAEWMWKEDLTEHKRRMGDGVEEQGRKSSYKTLCL